MKTPSLGLRGRLFVLVVISILFAFGLSLYTRVEHRRLEESQAREDVLRVARLVAAQQENVIVQAQQMLVSLGKIPVVVGEDRQACHQFLEKMRAEFPVFIDIGVLLPTGESFCRGTALPQPGEVSFFQRPGFKRMEASTEFLVVGYQISASRNKPILIVGYPVIDSNGQRVRMLVALLDVAWINQLAAEVRLPANTTVAVVDPMGTTVARYPDPDKWVGRRVSEAGLSVSASVSGEGTAQFRGADGVQRLYGFTPIGGKKHFGHVVIGTPMDVAFAQVDRLFYRNLAGLAVTAVLAVIATWLAGNALIVGKVDALVRASRRIATGDFGARAGLPHGRDEFGQLARSFDEMAASNQARQEALQKSESLLKAVIESALDSIFVKDVEGRFMMINSAGAQVRAANAADILGRKAEAFFTAEDARKVSEADQSVLQSGQPKTFEETLTVGGSVRTFLTTKAPLRDGNGKVIGIMGIARDITERQQLEEQLRQAQKMEAVGQLAGGVAHDFNNLLTAISGYSELLIAELGEDSKAKEDVEHIRGMCRKGADLVRQLLAFSRRQSLQPTRLNLNVLVEGTSKMLSRLIGSGISLQFKPGEDLWNVRADPGQMEQVLINLVINARDAMCGSGTLLIETRNSSRVHASDGDSPARGDSVSLMVSDTGCGMDAETQKHIFEPFFTTKEAGRGTGLGLSTVYGIVRQHTGHIQVISEPGKGATFRIDLPRADSAVSAKASEGRG